MSLRLFIVASCVFLFFLHVLVANPCFAWNDWGAQRFHGAGQSVHVKWSPQELVVELVLQWSWSAVTAVHLCSECSQTPLELVVELGLQWSWCAVTAVQLCSECSQTPPPRIGSWTWAAVKLMCSDCSPTLQWVQSDPPQLNLGCSEVDLQWLQSNFAVSAVRPPWNW